jgi:CBS domain-containing protein
MPSAKDVLASKKSPDVITVKPDCSVRDACRVMRDRRIGSVLILDGESIHGIFTERDVMNLVVAEGRDPVATKVSDVMTQKVIAVRPERPLEEIEAIMRQERVRHVPVVGDQGLLGIVSIGDLNAYNADQDHQSVEYLTQYIQGRA